MKSEPVEIIETYWNVNVGVIHETLYTIIEIIETYWNVNLDMFMSEVDHKKK